MVEKLEEAIIPLFSFNRETAEEYNLLCFNWFILKQKPEKEKITTLLQCMVRDYSFSSTVEQVLAIRILRQMLEGL